MPTYCYSTDDGEHVEVTMTAKAMGRRQRGDRITLDDGRKATRDFAAEWGSGARKHIGEWEKPLISLASGVDPRQIPQFKASAEQYRALTGIDVHPEFTPDGKAVYHSRQHQNRCLAWRGMHNQDGGYGDRAASPH